MVDFDIIISIKMAEDKGQTLEYRIVTNNITKQVAVVINGIDSLLLVARAYMDQDLTESLKVMADATQDFVDLLGRPTTSIAHDANNKIAVVHDRAQMLSSDESYKSQLGPDNYTYFIKQLKAIETAAMRIRDQFQNLGGFYKAKEQGSLTALLGVHEEVLLKTFANTLQYYGYSVTKATTPEEMIRLAEQNQHFAYIMDLNFGKPGSGDITPAIGVYNNIKSRVESGKARFVGISGNLGTVEVAKQQGIPSYHKTDFNIVKFAKQARKS